HWHDDYDHDHDHYHDDHYHHDDDHDCCEPDGPVIDINHAALDELLTLDGMNDDMADAIIQCRPFETFDDLESVEQIGTENVAKWMERLMLG
ncbi:MAG: helix-hairpin-helix domain-containing protein, partial [Verrucomicrobiota bacterium]